MKRESERARTSNGQKIQIRSNGEEGDLFKKLGGKSLSRWEEVIAISVNRAEDIRKEARQLGALFGKELLGAMEADNISILRYVVNRLTRIKRCLDSNTLEQVI